MEYATRLVVIRTAIGPKGYFEDFMEKGVDKAKEIIISSLEENPSGLDYTELEGIVEKGLENVEIRDWSDGWKMDAFMLGLWGLKLVDEKIKEIKSVFRLK